VRFGSIVAVRVQGITDSAASAQQMGDALKLLASLATMQGGNDPMVRTLTQSLNIASAGNQLNVGVSNAVRSARRDGGAEEADSSAAEGNPEVSK
jgi:hypothetical protein